AGTEPTLDATAGGGVSAGVACGSGLDAGGATGTVTTVPRGPCAGGSGDERTGGERSRARPGPCAGGSGGAVATLAKGPLTSAVAPSTSARVSASSLADANRSPGARRQALANHASNRSGTWATLDGTGRGRTQICSSSSDGF